MCVTLNLSVYRQTHNPKGKHIHLNSNKFLRNVFSNFEYM